MTDSIAERAMRTHTPCELERLEFAKAERATIEQRHARGSRLRAAWKPRATRWPDLRRVKPEEYVAPHEHSVYCVTGIHDVMRGGWRCECRCRAKGFLHDPLSISELYDRRVIWD